MTTPAEYLAAGEGVSTMAARRRRLEPPRWQTPMPPGVVGSWGPDVAAFAERELRIVLDRWQRRALNRALAYDANGRLVHRHYLISVARQNGKTALVRALIGWALTARRTPEWYLILGLAHESAQARIPYAAVSDDLEPMRARLGGLSRGGLTLTRYLGLRSRTFGRRERVYLTGSKEARDSIRGLSTDLAPFDEVRTQRDYQTWAALEPTTRARPDPLILATSTAGDDRSILLRDWWERGRRIIDGAEPAAGFGMTWYAPDDDDDPMGDRAIIAANPSIADGRMDAETVRASVWSLGALGYRSESLNLWSDAADEWLPPGLWADLDGPEPDAAGARIVLGVETTPTWRRCTVAVALAEGEGAWTGVAAELDASRTQASTIRPAELVDLLAGVVRRYRPSAVAYSASAAAAPHIETWCLANDVRTVPLGPRQLRAGSQLFRSELIGRRLRHPPDPLLAQQVRAARPSAPIEGGDWYLSIRDSIGEIDAVRACAWAAWAAIAPPDEEAGPLQIFV